MGRRKLPSLPQPYMASGINAPIYYTSSAPEPKDASCSTAGGILFDPSTASTTTKLTSAIRVQSLSRPSSALGSHSIDPAILPGATFKIASKSKQTILMPNGDLSTNKQRKLPKMTDTMSRVMLKKELREVLSKRRDKLDACEIEANHRQYVINRMLSSGIMPENRLPELDEIPSVVKCTLPLNIVKNAKIIPLKRPQVSIQSENIYQKPRMKSEGTNAIDWMEEDNVKQFNITSKSQPTVFKKSIAVQCEAPPKSVGTSTMPTSGYSGHYSSSISLKKQMMAEYEDYMHSSKKTVETQTENVNDTLKRKKFPKPTETNLLLQKNTSTTASGPDLLESTQRYFEEYDRRLREAADIKLDKQRFNFTENDIESKRQRVLDELARRREKISSMVDLRYLKQQTCPRISNNMAYPSSDYASTVPHYGSLPRIDYPARNRIPSGSQIRDFTSKTNYYGSLPRNYERYLDSMDQAYLDQMGTPGNLSRSLFNLNQVESVYPRYMQNPSLQTMNARSENYVDQMIMDDMLLSNNFNKNISQTTTEGDNMLSQYANYLNNQFLMTQQRDNFIDPLMDPYNTSPTLPQPMEDFTSIYPPQLSQQQQRYGSGYLDNQLRSSQVYSRNESNYGSRPMQPMTDYGNYLHNRVNNLRQLDNLQDLINHNVGVLPTPLPPNNYNPPIYNYQPTPWDNGYNTSSYNYQQQQQKQKLLQQKRRQQQQQQQRQINTSLYDTKYPCEDGLTRMYQTYGRRQRQPYSSRQNPDYLQSRQEQYTTSSLGRNMIGRINNNTTNVSRGRSMTNIGHEINELLKDYSATRQRRHIGKIKRILLTRRYKDHNIYNDIGIRVTGGKRLANGDLGAFVTAVNRGRGFETLNEIREGDQILEWNGVLLSGKTFEEMERIIAGSSGEIEIIIKNNEGHNQTENVYDDVVNFGYQRNYNKPPVPAHRGSSPAYQRQINVYNQRKDNIGTLILSFAYDQINRLLLVNIIGAKNLRYREYESGVILPNPFVKVYLLPGRKAINKRRTKYIVNTTDPDWHKTVDYPLNYHELPNYYLEFTVWDYGKEDNICLGQIIVSLSDLSLLNNLPRHYQLQRPDQSAIIHGLSNVPVSTTRLRTQSYYNPNTLDLGYPAIC